MSSTAIMMTLRDAQSLLPGSTLLGDPATPLLRVHSDSRSLQAGDLFVALAGERFDAHAFLREARTAGAAAALAQHGLSEAGLPGLLVPDTLVALQQLAAGWRARFELPLAAVTGSNGKTTVTQMVASILRVWHGPDALATAGNLNNHIGVPLTLLRLRPHHRSAVLELGMNHPGEIALLADLSAPTVALVNNAQREHQEFMASVQAVALENGAVLQALGPHGTAVYPADDAMTPLWQGLSGERPHLNFALTGPADLTDDALWVRGDGTPLGGPGHWALRLATPAGPVECQLHAAGQHNVRNAMAAAATALALGAPMQAVAQGLQAFRPVAGRSQMQALAWQGSACTLVDDSYNANPDSVRAAVVMLAGLPGPQWLVLGDMGEVGTQGPAFHAEVGAWAREQGVAHFWAVGDACAAAATAYGPGACRFADAGEAAAAVAGQAPPGFASVLVKGSRFMRMELVVRALQAAAATPAVQAKAGG